MNHVLPRPAIRAFPPTIAGELIFHPAAPCSLIRDPRTHQTLRLDGWWKTPDGRTLYAALSAPGSILRTAAEMEQSPDDRPQ
ncbi:MAG TPA: hypothetical protein VNC39_01525 [Acidocella sp.]|jgi:hypothetical protein|uniref:hypothetical protein n=1 Tax=Acidocella sp. TaxID=50710 RepID=UPI002C7069E6|nr:hypothetical protein [Acidocella sp.]HVE20630.1 hypothetical protein [Acidocella sp.]